ncbi:MAG: NUDIX domain-containing protein [bacterium]
MRKINIIYLVDDGITGYCSGVGTVAKNFISAFSSIKREFDRSFGINLSLNVITFSNSNNEAYDFKHVANKIVNDSGGKIIEIEWPKSLSENYFNFEVWKDVNKDVNKIIEKEFEGERLFIVNDFIFSQFDFKEDDYYVFIPHSLNKSQAQAYVDGEEREKFEKKAIEKIISHKKAKIGYLSLYAKNILMKEYNLEESVLVPASNGYVLDSFNLPINPEEVLNHCGIPLDKKLLISISRADVYKGVEEVIEIMDSFLAKNSQYHGVLVASQFSQEPELIKYQRKLKELLLSPRITYIDKFEPDLPRILYGYPKSRALFCLPRIDFAPLVPIEAMLFSHPELALCISDAGCFKGMIVDRENGFLIRGDLSNRLNRISEILGDKYLPTVKKVNENGKNYSFQNFDIFNNYFELILTTIFDKDIKTHYSAGGVITRNINSKTEFLLTEHLEKTYSFPKGHLEAGETPEEAAKREIIEETGFVDFSLVGKLGEVRRYSMSKEDGMPVRKIVTLFKVILNSPKRNKEYEEVCDWFEAEEAVKVLRYKQDSDFLAKHISIEKTLT